MSRTKKVSIHPEGVFVKGNNRRIAIIKKTGTKDKAKNIIIMKALTAELTEHPGVRHELSDNKKIKYSFVGLTDEAVMDLHIALGEYLFNKHLVFNQ